MKRYNKYRQRNGMYHKYSDWDWCDWSNRELKKNLKPIRIKKKERTLKKNSYINKTELTANQYINKTELTNQFLDELNKHWEFRKTLEAYART